MSALLFSLHFQLQLIESRGMSLALIGRILLSIPILRFAVLAWEKQIKSKAELERHSVSAEELHDFIGSGRKQAAYT